MKIIRSTFTLIELLMAMGVILIGITGLMALFVIGSGDTRAISDAYFAENTASQLMAYVRYNLEMYASENGFYNTTENTGLRSFTVKNSFSGTEIEKKIGKSADILQTISPTDLRPIDLGKMKDYCPSDDVLSAIDFVAANPSERWTEVSPNGEFFPPKSVYLKAGHDSDALYVLPDDLNHASAKGHDITYYTYLFTYTYAVKDNDANDSYSATDIQVAAVLWKEQLSNLNNSSDLCRIKAKLFWPITPEMEFKDMDTMEVYIDVKNPYK